MDIEKRKHEIMREFSETFDLQWATSWEADRLLLYFFAGKLAELEAKLTPDTRGLVWYDESGRAWYTDDHGMPVPLPNRGE